MNLSKIKNDIGLSLFLIGVCIAFLWDARDIPPGSFEPLGAGPVPRMIASTVIIICVIISTQALLQWRHIKRSGTTDPAEEPLPYRPRSKEAVILLVLTVIYGIVMAFGWVSFAVSTILFLFFTISLLTDFNRKSMLIAAVIALIMGFGCQYLFTEIFVVDLPTG